MDMDARKAPPKRDPPFHKNSVPHGFSAMEATSRQSIPRRGLVRSGFDEQRRKNWSHATHGGLPTGFDVINLHFPKDLGRCAVPRL